MKKLLLLLLLFSLVCFAQNNEANELLESGIQKVFDDDYNSALDDFNKAIKLDYKGTLAHKVYFERAQLKRRYLKDYKGALKDYNTSIKLNPNYVRAYLYRSILYGRNFRDKVNEEKGYRKSIEIDPECGACWMQLSYLSTISLDEQLKSAEKAIKLGLDLNFNGKLSPTYFLYQRIGSIKINQGDYLGAIEYYQKLIDNYQPYDSDGDGQIDEEEYLPSSYFFIANTYYYYLNKPLMALEFLNKAIEIQPDRSYYTLRAKIKYNNKDFDDALINFELAKKTKPKTYFNTTYVYTEFYPYVELNRDIDTISLPISVKTRIDIYDILDLETTSNQFFMGVRYNIYTKKRPYFLNYKKDTIRIFDFEKTTKVEPFYITSDRNSVVDTEYQGVDKINITDEVSYYGAVEADFFHNWDLKNYPFDTQKLKFQIGVPIDTSFVRLSQSEIWKSNFNTVKDLKEGYKIEKIIFEETFYEPENKHLFYPGVIRKVVYPVANYSILVSRSGGWLFVKLFLGSFLAFLISWIVFLIPNKEFDSRISLTVGGIFGAIGNRYFVDSTIPAVQVLTKADMINNLILGLLILNVLIVIIQKNNKINFGILEQNKFAMIFTGISFVLFNSLIVLW